MSRLLSAEMQLQARNEPSALADQVTANLDVHRTTMSAAANATNELLLTEVNGQPLSADEIVSPLRNADSVDLDCNTDYGLVWGHGIHLCLGAPLARLEMRAWRWKNYWHGQLFSK